MRALMALMITAGSFAAVEPDPEAEHVIEAVRWIVVSQRADGGWGDPNIVRVTTVPPPQRVGEPPLPPIAPEDRYRSDAAAFSRTAAALWRARWCDPAAAVAAARAQDLAARALIARADHRPSLDEAIAFLRAEQARSEEPPEGAARAAAKACRSVMSAAIDAGSIEQLHLGLPAVENSALIDLRLTWTAASLIERRIHSWLEPRLVSNSARISRHQRRLPETTTDRPLQVMPIVPFDDGSPFAAALLSEPADGIMAWLRPIAEAEDAEQLEPERGLAYLNVFTRRGRDPEGAWWRACVTSWTNCLLTKARRVETPSGPILDWEEPSRRNEVTNAIALRWLLAVHRIEGNRRLRAWETAHVTEPLARLGRTQNTDGTWSSPGEADPTALACLAFIGAGYDHQTPNRHRDVVGAGLRALMRTDPAAGSMSDRALRTMAVAEAFAISGDADLRLPARQRLDRLQADQLPGGGWSDESGGTADWKTSALALMAMKAGQAGNFPISYDDAAAWWRAQTGDGANVPVETLAWQAVAGLMLGERERATTLTRALVARLHDEQPADDLLFPASMAIAAMGGEAWSEWVHRARKLPIGESGGLRLLGDELLYRYQDQKEKSD